MVLKNNTSEMITFTDRKTCKQWSCAAGSLVDVPENNQNVIDKFKRYGCIENKAKKVDKPFSQKEEEDDDINDY